MVSLNRLMIRDPERYSIVTGKGYRPRLIRLGKWRYIALGLVSCYVVLTVIAPLSVLLWVSFLPFYQAPSHNTFQLASLKNYLAIRSRIWCIGAVVNTLVVGVATATLVLLLAFAISWVVVRLKPPRNRHSRWGCVSAPSDSVDHHRSGDDHPLCASAAERVSHLRHGLDHCSGVDDALSCIRHPRHEWRDCSSFERSGGGCAREWRGANEHAFPHYASLDSPRLSQRVDMACRACHARLLDPADSRLERYRIDRSPIVGHVGKRRCFQSGSAWASCSLPFWD